MLTFTILGSDADLMAAFEARRSQNRGGEIGQADQSPHEAAESTGWRVVRAIHSGTNGNGTAVLAQDAWGALWVVDDPGPWAVRVTDT
jgi:hypothetical protein